jgi:hypothetical protein
MRVLSNLLGNGSKIKASEVVVTPELLLDEAVIVERGSNANGQYTRLANGLLIQVIVIDINSTSFANWNGWGRYSRKVNLPAEFSNREYSVKVGWTSNHLAISQTISQEESGFTTYFLRSDTASGTLGRVTFIAIGQ